MKLLITICARGGSKGIPNKNIKELNGKPLIYYSLKNAIDFKNNIDYDVDVVLSTDSNKIKKTVTTFNFDIDTDYIRPEFLASDTAGKLDAIEDVKIYMEEKHQKSYDYILDLDVTAPLRTIEDLKDAFQTLENDQKAYNIFSVNAANRNPYFNMVEKNEDGYFSLSKKGTFLSRQSAPKVYDMNASFYIYKKEFFELNHKTAVTNKSLIFEMQHICFDLDHPIDFDFMEYLLSEDKLDFDFKV